MTGLPPADLNPINYQPPPAAADPAAALQPQEQAVNNVAQTVLQNTAAPLNRRERARLRARGGQVNNPAQAMVIQNAALNNPIFAPRDEGDQAAVRQLRQAENNPLRRTGRRGEQMDSSRDLPPMPNQDSDSVRRNTAAGAA